MRSYKEFNKFSRKVVLSIICFFFLPFIFPFQVFSQSTSDLFCMQNRMNFISEVHILTSPEAGTAFYFPPGAETKYKISTDAENTTLGISGSLPQGLDWGRFNNLLNTVVVYGTLNEPTTVAFTVLAIASDGSPCDCQTELGYLITTTPPPASPKDVTVEEIELIGGMVNARSKKCGGKIQYEKIIRWKSPKASSDIVKYKIFKDNNFARPIGIVSSHSRNRYKFVDRDVDPCRKSKYDLVSTNEIGGNSLQVRAKKRIK